MHCYVGFVKGTNNQVLNNSEVEGGEMDGFLFTEQMNNFKCLACICTLL